MLLTNGRHGTIILQKLCDFMSKYMTVRLFEEAFMISTNTRITS